MKGLKTYLVSGATIAALLPSFAMAEGGNFYGGIGVHNSYFVTDKGINAPERDTNMASVGGHLGYRYKFDNQVFVAGEAFYLNTDQDETFSNGDSIDVGNQYGAKMNVGYEWDNGISAYGIIGASHLDYKLVLNGDTVDEDAFVPLLGGGLGYRFNPTLSSQLELTTLGDEVNIAGDRDKSIGAVNVRLAMTYDF